MGDASYLKMKNNKIVADIFFFLKSLKFYKMAKLWNLASNFSQTIRVALS